MVTIYCGTPENNETGAVGVRRTLLIICGAVGLMATGCASDSRQDCCAGRCESGPAAVKATPNTDAARTSGMGEMTLIPSDAPPIAAESTVGRQPTAVNESAAEAALRARAQRLWQARVDNDYDTWYSILDPRVRDAGDVAAFKEFCETREPFQHVAFKFDHVVVDGEMGWIDVSNSVKMRQMPRIPAREVSTEEKWHVQDGEWVLTSRVEIPDYPVSPLRRDGFEEGRLRERWEEAWKLRAAVREKEDFATVLRLVDPRDVEHIHEEDWNEMNNIWRYLDAEVLWIEVLKGADKGRIHARYTRKINDSSMTKTPPQDDVVTEEWIQLDGQWYMNVSSDKE